jgi:hypothetical protein
MTNNIQQNLLNLYIKEGNKFKSHEKEYSTAIDDLKKENKGLKESNQYNCHKVIMLNKK